MLFLRDLQLGLSSSELIILAFQPIVFVYIFCDVFQKCMEPLFFYFYSIGIHNRPSYTQHILPYVTNFDFRS